MRKGGYVKLLSSPVPGTDFVCKTCIENLTVDLCAELCAESEK